MTIHHEVNILSLPQKKPCYYRVLIILQNVLYIDVLNNIFK